MQNIWLANPKGVAAHRFRAASLLISENWFLLKIIAMGQYLGKELSWVPGWESTGKAEAGGSLGLTAYPPWSMWLVSGQWQTLHKGVGMVSSQGTIQEASICAHTYSNTQTHAHTEAYTYRHANIHEQHKSKQKKSKIRSFKTSLMKDILKT